MSGKYFIFYNYLQYISGKYFASYKTFKLKIFGEFVVSVENWAQRITICNPNTQEAKAGESPQIWGQLEPSST